MKNQIKMEVLKLTLMLKRAGIELMYDIENNKCKVMESEML